VILVTVLALGLGLGFPAAGRSVCRRDPNARPLDTMQCAFCEGRCATALASTARLPPDPDVLRFTAHQERLARHSRMSRLASQADPHQAHSCVAPIAVVAKRRRSTVSRDVEDGRSAGIVESPAARNRPLGQANRSRIECEGDPPGPRRHRCFWPRDPRPQQNASVSGGVRHGMKRRPEKRLQRPDCDI
jgi:hypothetical protein